MKRRLPCLLAFSEPRPTGTMHSRLAMGGQAVSYAQHGAADRTAQPGLCRLFDVITDPLQHPAVVTIILAQLKMNRPSLIQEGLRMHCILGGRALLSIDTQQQSQ